MPNNYVRFQEHEFESNMSDELHDFVFGCDNREVASNVRETWYMDKPVSRIHVPKEISYDQADMLREHFNHYTQEVQVGQVSQFLHISRFPELAEFAATCETAVDGLLFGFDARDVASFVEMETGDISANPKS